MARSRNGAMTARLRCSSKVPRKRGMDDMTRWFKHVAVFAAWLGLGAPVVLAQPGYPATVGAARQIGPLHYVPDQPPPNLAPGPVHPLGAPAGPPPTPNLPAAHTNAFR